MNIGLIDVDNHNFPSLPLMKISSYHKSIGDNVEMWTGLKHYDKVYMSKVFTHTKDIDFVIMADEIVKGGTGYCNKTKLYNIHYKLEYEYPDYMLYKITDTAYGFLTRGCNRKCGFCIVPKKEGNVSHKVADLCYFWNGQKTIKLLDPNILACIEREDLLNQLIESKAYIDFTQGLDVRLVDLDIIMLLDKMKIKMLHFAWDNANDKETVKKLQLFVKHSKNTNERTRGVYVLTNYNSTHEQDLYRIYELKHIGFNPYVMIYDKQKAPEITRKLQRWVNNKWIFRSCEKFEDYYKNGG